MRINKVVPVDATAALEFFISGMFRTGMISIWNDFLFRGAAECLEEAGLFFKDENNSETFSWSLR